MGIVDYPFDSERMLRERRKIKKELLETGIAFIEKRIAVLGGSTTKDVVDMMELFLLNMGIKVQIYQSDFDQYEQEALFPSRELIDFNPEIVYIHTSVRNLRAFPNIQMSKTQIDAFMQAEIEKYTNIWSGLLERFSCIVIQNNFELPPYRLFGNKDASDIHGKVNYISRLNCRLYEEIDKRRHVFVNDLNYTAASYGLERWVDQKCWNLYKYAMDVHAIPAVAYSVSNIIKSILGKSKKVLVTDLDHTLWGGVIGEDGLENLEIGHETALGEAYTAFQNYLLELKNRGVVLAVLSKNDLEAAMKGLRHPENTISPQDFAVIKANWNHKHENYQEIASELNVLPESMVFVDDNPAERALIRETFPETGIVDKNSVDDFVSFIDKAGFFEASYLSDDDMKRGQMYGENVKREQSRQRFSDYRDYLIFLKMHAEIRPFDYVHLPRIAQLTGKSNQFNLTTKRYTAAELEMIMNDTKRYLTLYGKLTDRFGDNGIVSLVIGEICGKELHIDLWLMSCRVLKRGFERAMMDALLEQGKAHNMQTVKGYYYPTAKNEMVREFYGTMGFLKISETKERTIWERKIPKNYQRINHIIAVTDTR